MMRSSRDSEEGGASRGNVKPENADAIAIQGKATQNLAAAAATAVAAVAAVAWRSLAPVQDIPGV